MNPSRKPSWRVVSQRLARAIVALASPPPGGMTWSSRSVSSLLISDSKAPVLARTQPARSTTPERSTTPGSGLPSASDRAGTIRSIAAAYSGSTARSSAGSRVPGAERMRLIAKRSTSGQSTSPRRAARSARRPATVATAPRAEPIRKPACHTRSSRHDGPFAPRADRPVIGWPPRARPVRRQRRRCRTAGRRARGRRPDHPSSAGGASRRPTRPATRAR